MILIKGDSDLACFFFFYGGGWGEGQEHVLPFLFLKISTIFLMSVVHIPSQLLAGLLILNLVLFHYSKGFRLRISLGRCCLGDFFRGTWKECTTIVKCFQSAKTASSWFAVSTSLRKAGLFLTSRVCFHMSSVQVTILS